MEITAGRKEFSDALQIASSLAPTRTPLEVLRSVKLEIAGDRAVLQGSNTVQSVSVAVMCEAHKPGVVLLPPAAKAIISNCMSEQITIKETRTGISISDGSRNASKLHTVPPDAFPELPPVPCGVTAAVPGDQMQQALRATLFAAGRSAEKWSVNCLRLEMDSAGVHFVGTDLRRVAHYTTELQSPCESVHSCQIPLAATQVLAKVAGKSHEVVLSWDAYRCHAKCGSVELFSSILEGSYPPWRRGMNTATGAPATFVAADLVPLLSQGVSLVDESHTDIKVSVRQDLLTVSTETRIGSLEASIPVNYLGPESYVNVSPQYMIEFLRLVPAGEKVELIVTGPHTIALLRYGQAECGIAPIVRE